MGGVLCAGFLSWEEKFGHGSSPRPVILSSGLPSTLEFGHIFLPEYVENVLVDDIFLGS